MEDVDLIEDTIYDWPNTSLGSKFKELDICMRCTICMDQFRSPQTLKCGHSFCFICISNHFKKNTYCPCCRESASITTLYPSKVIMEIIQQYKPIRILLLNYSKEIKDLKKIDSVIHNESDLSKKIANRLGKPGKETSNKIQITKRIPHTLFHGESKEKIKKSIEKLMNNFHTKQKLRLDGDRDALIRRHRNFIILYNSQINELNPMTIDQIISEINTKELAQEKNELITKKSARIVDDIKNGKETKEVTDKFKELINDIKRRKAASKAIATSNQNNQIVEEKENDNNEINNHSNQTDKEHLNSRIQEGSDEDSWIVTMSESLKRPFFFNHVTGIGQFEVPEELSSQYDFQEEEEEGEEEEIVASNHISQNDHSVMKKSVLNIDEAEEELAVNTISVGSIPLYTSTQIDSQMPHSYIDTTPRQYRGPGGPDPINDKDMDLSPPPPLPPASNEQSPCPPMFSLDESQIELIHNFNNSNMTSRAHVITSTSTIRSESKSNGRDSTTHNSTTVSSDDDETTKRQDSQDDEDSQNMSVDFDDTDDMMYERSYSAAKSLHNQDPTQDILDYTATDTTSDTKRRKNNSMGGITSDKWSCNKCTFLNSGLMLVCEICEQPCDTISVARQKEILLPYSQRFTRSMNEKLLPVPAPTTPSTSSLFQRFGNTPQSAVAVVPSSTIASNNRIHTRSGGGGGSSKNNKSIKRKR